MDLRPPPAHRGLCTFGPLEVALVREEAARQRDAFYPRKDKPVKSEVTGRLYQQMDAIEAGILQQLRAGVAIIRRGRLFFWHGYRHCYRVYDHEQNRYFLELARELFSQRRLQAFHARSRGGDPVKN